MPESRRTSGPVAEVLRGFRIGVTSDRRSSDLIAALERRGANVLHAPALMIAPNDHDSVLVAETREVIDARPEAILITTGYGMRRWFEVADAAGMGAELTAALEESRIFARGPKAQGAVRAAGLLENQDHQLDTTASLVDAVGSAGLSGRTVAIQLHGYTDVDALDRLRRNSGRVLTVTPYRWVPPNVQDRLTRLIRAAALRQLDAVTFTSAPAAAATLEAASAAGLGAQFVRALSGPVAAVAVGPVTAEPLRDAGVDPIMPDRFRLGAMIRLVTEELSERRIRRYRSGAVVIEVRGRIVSVNGSELTLGPNALALLCTLADTSAVVSRQELIDCLPDELDDHALEVAMSRLRRALGVPGVITTVVKRGYRFNGERID